MCLGHANHIRNGEVTLTDQLCNSATAFECVPRRVAGEHVAITPDDLAGPLLAPVACRSCWRSAYGSCLASA
jgi:hypothetical protein